MKGGPHVHWPFPEHHACKPNCCLWGRLLTLYSCTGVTFVLHQITKNAQGWHWWCTRVMQNQCYSSALWYHYHISIMIIDVNLAYLGNNIAWVGVQKEVYCESPFHWTQEIKVAMHIYRTCCTWIPNKYRPIFVFYIVQTKSDPCQILKIYIHALIGAV